jgi:hypothetical protein
VTPTLHGDLSEPMHQTHATNIGVRRYNGSTIFADEAAEYSHTTGRDEVALKRERARFTQ